MTQLIYPATNFGSTEQPIITRGEGVYVCDQRGRRYLEGLAGSWRAKAVTSGYLPLSVAAIRGEMYERLIAPSEKVGVFGRWMRS